MFEVVWRDNPGDAWQLWDPNPGYGRNAWHGAHNAEPATLDCKKAHPGAEIIIRPTLDRR